MFVAVAAAGMLASCSSESLTGSDSKIDPAQEELVPIEINVATPIARATTRGTGTVGGVALGNGTAANNDGSTDGAVANSWAGEKINVYMFNKGTLDIAQFTTTTGPSDIFNNAELIAPATGASGKAKYPETTGEPATPTGNYYQKYYPQTGSYDFWGYRIDDAVVTAAAAKNGAGDKYQVGITVNGTQDVLGAKTVATPYNNLTEDQKTAFGNDATYQSKLYSASAARQEIQPSLEFNHLMTRLTFEAYPGNDNAKSVYIYGIKVRSIKNYSNPAAPVYNTPNGVLDIAGTGEFTQKVTWTTSTDVAEVPQFQLMKRTGAANTPLVALCTYDPDNISTHDWTANGAVSMNVTPSNDEDQKVAIGEAIIAPDAQAYELEILLVQEVRKYTEESTGTGHDDKVEYLFNTIKTVQRAGTAPSIPDFLIGNTYDFIIKVYGLEKIEINTVLKPWIYGENVTVPIE